MDLSGLIAVVDTAPIGASVVAVGALVIVPLVAVFAVRHIIEMIAERESDRFGSQLAEDDEERRERINMLWDRWKEEEADDLFRNSEPD